MLLSIVIDLKASVIIDRGMNKLVRGTLWCSVIQRLLGMKNLRWSMVRFLHNNIVVVEVCFEFCLDDY